MLEAINQLSGPISAFDGNGLDLTPSQIGRFMRREVNVFHVLIPTVGKAPTKGEDQSPYKERGSTNSAAAFCIAW